MAKQSSLPKSELEILRIVWDLGEVTVRQVVDALPSNRELDFWTVQTYLRRLKNKGFLKVHRDGRTNVYQAKQAPNRVMTGIIDDFLSRVFDGEALPLFQHLIETRSLTDDEIEKLQQQLDHMAKRK